jgi:hypothetical protein
MSFEGHVSVMRAEIERLRKALGFYARGDHFDTPPDFDKGQCFKPQITHVSRTYVLSKVETGAVARAALGESEKEINK